MQAGKSGGLFEGMFRCRDHQKEQRASANALKALTDGDVTFDPRVQGARGHGASPWYESSDMSGGDDSTGKRSRCPDPWGKDVICSYTGESLPVIQKRCGSVWINDARSMRRYAAGRCKRRCLSRHRFWSWVEPTTHCFFIRSGLRQRSRAPFKYEGMDQASCLDADRRALQRRGMRGGDTQGGGVL